MIVAKTPRQLADEKREADARRLALALPLEPRWDLPTTLLWIGLRDMDRVASVTAEWREAAEAVRKMRYTFDSQDLVEMVQGYLEGDIDEDRPEDGLATQYVESLTTRPDTLLLQHLRRGDVISNGERAGLYEPIEAVSWESVDWRDKASIGNKAFAAQWPSVLFDRVSVMRVFPRDAADGPPFSPPANLEAENSQLPKRHDPTPDDQSAFVDWASSEIRTKDEVEAWRLKRGISRAWARKQRAKLPSDQKLGAGQRKRK